MIFFQTAFRFDTLRLLFISLLLFTASAKTPAQNSREFSLSESPLPAPTSPVMDYAGVLDPGVKANLEKRIIAFRDSTNPRVELAVAIVRTTGDRPIDMYSLAVARGWKIGSKAEDNPSALLFVAIDDRKYFTQVSRDLEDELPDGLTGQLQRQYLVPAFKQGDYGKGVTDTIEAYIRTIQARSSGGNAATGPTPRTERAGRSQTSLCGFVICLLVIFFILAIIFGRGSGGGGGRNDRDRWRGGGFGGGGGSSGALPFIVGSILGSSLGSGSSSSSGSDWGGSSGGGDSWGGFGGGGDFGGGGSGGDW